MKSKTLRFWIVIPLCILSLMGSSVVLIYYTKREFLSPGEALQVVTLLLLLMVTFWYAYSTDRINRAAAEQVDAIREQAKISGQALKVASDAEKNSVMPIVRLEPGDLFSDTTFSDEANVKCRNIGRGPALNLIIWLNSKTGPEGEMVRSTVQSDYAMGVRETRVFTWRAECESYALPRRQGPFNIVAEYYDVFGGKFRSKFRVDDYGDGTFYFEMVRDEQY